MMQKELLNYYNQELEFIRRMAADFAREYPAIASQLDLDEQPKKCKDPHVERLLEGFALLSARVRKKIDDEFPEITEALLGILYPHYLRPVPSMAMMQFELDRKQSKITSGYVVPKDTELISKPVDGFSVQFRTGYPVTLWPIEVEAASFVRASALANTLPSTVDISHAFAAIHIELKTFGSATFMEMPLNDLRFHLNGDTETTYTLHELIFNNAYQVVIRDPESRESPAVVLEADFLKDVGYKKDEGLLPYDERSFLGYRLLQEYFCFPQKFLFFDIQGFDRIPRTAGNRRNVTILLNEFGLRERLVQLERRVNKDTFLLGCTPAVNLFERQAEAIRLTQRQTEYRIVADRYHETSTEVYSVESVTSSRPDTEEVVRYEPFYSLRHTYGLKTKQSAFWIANRRDSIHKEDVKGTEVYLSLVDLEFRPTVPPDNLLSLRVTCTNRDLPAKLTGTDGEFEMTAGPLVSVRCRQGPTKSLRPASRRSLQWRLISHLSLNGLSIIEGGEAFQELLKLYDFSEDPIVQRQIEGITQVTSGPHFARVTSEDRKESAMCLGTRVQMEFDEVQFVGNSAFLMASVIERFIGLYSSVNSFSQLVAKSRQRRGILKQWPTRTGSQILL